MAQPNKHPIFLWGAKLAEVLDDIIIIREQIKMLISSYKELKEMIQLLKQQDIDNSNNVKNNVSQAKTTQPKPKFHPDELKALLEKRFDVP